MARVHRKTFRVSTGEWLLLAEAARRLDVTPSTLVRDAAIKMAERLMEGLDFPPSKAGSPTPSYASAPTVDADG